MKTTLAGGMLLTLVAGGTVGTAQAQSTAFHITDAAGYSAWVAAVRAAEYVREDYIVGSVPAQCPSNGGVTEAFTPGTKPRVIAVVAGTMAFVERNPHASNEQIGVFITGFDAALRAAQPADTQLTRRANFLQALRYARVLPRPAVGATSAVLPELVGTDTDVGARALELLGIQIDGPIDYFGLQDRMMQFEKALVGSLAVGPELALLLTHAFMDQGPNGEALRATTLDTSLAAFLQGEGYDPRLGAVRAELCGVNEGIAQLPADYSAYLAAVGTPLDADSAHGSDNPLQSRFDAAFDHTLDVVEETRIAISTIPERGIVDSLAGTPGEISAVVRQQRARMRQLSASRTAMFASMVAIAQGENQEADRYEYVQAQMQAAKGSQRLSQDLATAEGSVRLAAGIGSLAAGLAWENPYYVGVGINETITGAFGIGGASSTISNAQISAQIAQLSQQLGAVQTQLNDRFDRVDMRINTLFSVCVDGFEYLGQEITALSQQVEILQQDIDVLQYSLDLVAFDIWVQSSQVRRLEDALFGVAQDLLGQNFIGAVFDVIAYRAVNITDLAYGGPAPSFVAGANDIFQFASVDAKSEAYGGSRTSPFQISQAAETLNPATVARHINDLAVNATAFGVPALATQQVVAPEPWAQSVAAYVELARENPWYYAYLLGNEAGTPQITRMINDGQALLNVQTAARNPALFNSLVADYKSKTLALQNAINAVIDDALVTNVPLPLGTTQQSISWTDWLTAPVGQTSTATGVINPANPVNVTFSGNVTSFTVTDSAGVNRWIPAGAYTSATLPNPPANADAIFLERANAVNTITFSRPVTNPVLALVSVGTSGLQLSLTFSSPITLLSSGAGFFGSGTLAVRNGNILDGREGNGLIQLNGTFTSISWTGNQLEGYGIQVGVPASTMLDVWMNTDDPASVQDVRAIAPPLGTQFVARAGLPACCGLPSPVLPFTTTGAAYEGYWTLCRSDANLNGNGGGRQRYEQLRALLRRNAGVNVGAPTYDFTTPHADPTYGEIFFLDRANSTDSTVRSLGFRVYWLCNEYDCGYQEMNNGSGPLYLSYVWPQLEPLLASQRSLEGTQYNWSRSGYVSMRIEIVEDTVTSSATSGIRTEINQRLFQVRDTLVRPVVRSALTSQTGPALRVAVYNAAQALDDSAALLAAYANLAVPFEIDVSDVLKSAFRGNPARSELGLGASAVQGLINFWDDVDSANVNDSGNRSQSERGIKAVLDARVDAVQAEILRAITTRPLEGSGYVEWTLAEARSLRDHASRLAIDDTFASAELATANVLANDVRQSSTPGATRGLEVDPTFGPGSTGYLAPTEGLVVMQPHGTFTFTPSNQNFVGRQTFSYRARCNIAAPGAGPVWVLSLPAYVTIEITDAGCPADYNRDEGVDGDDIIAFFADWDRANPAADFNGDEGVDGDDVIAFFTRWDMGC